MVILTAKEAAELLKCTRQCIWAKVRAKRIPHFRIGKRGSIRFERDALIEWAKGHNRNHL